MGLSATVLTRRFSSVGRALTAVTLGTFAVYFAWTALLVEWRIQLRARLNALDSAKGAYFVDSLAGQEAIKLYGNEAAEEQRFDGILRSIATTSLRSALVGSMLNAGQARLLSSRLAGYSAVVSISLFFRAHPPPPTHPSIHPSTIHHPPSIQALIFAAGLLGSLLLAAQGFGRGQLSLGDVVAINALLLQLSRPMEFIGYTVSEVRQSLADMDAMARLLLLPDTPTTVRPSVGPADAPPSDVNSLPLTPPEVRFEGVSYRYPNASAPALDHVSFVAPAGGTTVLVGTSGSGKSTALRLLARLRDADSGAVNAWGRDVRGVTGAALRQRIGFVTQARRAALQPRPRPMPRAPCAGAAGQQRRPGLAAPPLPAPCAGAHALRRYRALQHPLWRVRGARGTQPRRRRRRRARWQPRALAAGLGDAGGRARSVPLRWRAAARDRRARVATLAAAAAR